MRAKYIQNTCKIIMHNLQTICIIKIYPQNADKVMLTCNLHVDFFTPNAHINFLLTKLPKISKIFIAMNLKMSMAIFGHF